MLNLFTIDEGTKLPKPNPELILLSPFKDIMRRIKPCEGDADGRRKILNIKEFAYIYFAVKAIETTEDEIRYKKMIGLPETWEPDDIVKAGIEAYRESQWTPAIDSVKRIKKSLASLNSFIDHGNIQLQSLTLNNSREVNEFLDVLDRLPSTIETLKKAEATLEREQEALAKGKKGRTVNKFELPD